MRIQAPVCAAILACAALLGPVRSAVIPFPEISAALAAGKGAEALALTDAALSQAGLADADRARLFLDRGLARHLQGDANDALTGFTQAIEAHSLSTPEQARAYLERGLILDGMGRLNDAIGDYGAVLRLDSGSAAALNNRANAYRRQNRFDEARRDYLASLAAENPAPEYPYYGLGQIAESQGKPVEARNFYTRAVAANPDYSLAGERLAALDGTMAPAQTITLHPPKSMAAEKTLGAEKGPVMLHPPAVKSAAIPQPAIKPADYSPHEQPGLRPALDNPGGQQVQLGAWRAESEAAEGWNRAVKEAGGALSGFAPHIVAVDLPGRGRYYRLRVETLDGKQLCAVLAAKGLPCIPARD